MLYQEGKTLELVDPSLAKCNSEEAALCIQIGLLCCLQNVVDRPDIRKIHLWLSSDSFTFLDQVNLEFKAMESIGRPTLLLSMLMLVVQALVPPGLLEAIVLLRIILGILFLSLLLMKGDNHHLQFEGY